MTEHEKMISGLPYNALDPTLSEMREKADRLCCTYNAALSNAEKAGILKELLENRRDSVTLQGPIYFTYGKNISFGKNFYANFNLTILDHGGVTIGDHVMFGPNCTLVTANHPLYWEDRRVRTDSDGNCFDIETAAPIRIGDDCWLGAGVTVCPGVTIRAGSVIAAGSVVTSDIPEHVLAAGVPCHVLRPITPEQHEWSL